MCIFGGLVCSCVRLVVLCILWLPVMAAWSPANDVAVREAGSVTQSRQCHLVAAQQPISRQSSSSSGEVRVDPSVS